MLVVLIVQGVADELPPVKANCMPQSETHRKRADCPGWYQSSAKNNVTRSGYWNETRVVARYFPAQRLSYATGVWICNWDAWAPCKCLG
jgi:hypothetical protein